MVLSLTCLGQAWIAYGRSMVGVVGLEPTASPTPWVRASQLRHTPTVARVIIAKKGLA